MLSAVLDIGSNSIKLMICEKSEDGKLRIIEFLKNMLPLGKNTFYRGRITQELINQAVIVLKKYRRVVSGYGITEVKVIATTAVRESGNKSIFIDIIKRETGFEVEVLTVGDVVYYMDAYLSYKLKSSYPFHSKNILIAEFGSGSLDLSILCKGATLVHYGFPMGTLRIKQLLSKLDGSLEENYDAVEDYVENEFRYISRMIPDIELDDIFLMDENYSSFLPRIFPGVEKKADIYHMNYDANEEFFMDFRSKTPEEIAGKFDLPIDISDTISAYTIILKNFFFLVKSKKIHVLEISLAEAIISNILMNLGSSEKYDKAGQLESMARFICHRLSADISHAENVANLSRYLFDGLKDYLQFSEDSLIYLILASYFHDIGITINNRSHHKHAEYIISNLNLFRLSDEENNIIACIARYHRKASPSKSHVLYNSLTHKNKIMVQKLSAILRVANALDRSHQQKIKKIKVNCLKNNDINIYAYSHKNIVLEKMDFSEKKSYLEEIVGGNINLFVKAGQINED